MTCCVYVKPYTLSHCPSLGLLFSTFHGLEPTVNLCPVLQMAGHASTIHLTSAKLSI